VSAGGLLTTLMEMCFANTTGGMEVDISGMPAEAVPVLFSEKPGVVIQVGKHREISALLEKEGILHHVIGRPIEGRELVLRTREETLSLDIGHYRDLWFRTSYLLDRKQSGEALAAERYEHFKQHALEFRLGDFTGSFESLGIDPKRRTQSGVTAAIIREKGVNGDREMAHALYLAGFDVKDVHMTDLITGRESLEEVQMIVFVGGFSNSDVLGSAKGWAGAFKYNEKARVALEKFYARKDTLSLGVCNGCQLMVELDLVVPGHDQKPRMEHNASGKFESAFLGLKVVKNPSVMLGSLEGMNLGIWVAHGEGRFVLPRPVNEYHIAAKYSHSAYPANPNGSDHDVAALCSADGRHLAIMPHLERAYQPWQCAYYPENRRQDEATPWLEAFVNARRWVEKARK
jgi:phosphoribosylformylglycinamidine synthase